MKIVDQTLTKFRFHGLIGVGINPCIFNLIIFNFDSIILHLQFYYFFLDGCVYITGDFRLGAILFSWCFLSFKFVTAIVSIGLLRALYDSFHV